MDTSNFDRKQKEVNSGLNKLDNSTKTTQKSFENTSGSVGGLVTKYGSLALKIGLVAGAFYALKKSMDPIIKAGESAEGSITTLTVLLGSEEKALKAYNKAIEMSTRTPFDPREVASATALAAQFGQTDVFSKSLQGANNTKTSVMEIIAGMASFRDMEGNFIGMQRAASALLRGELAMLDNYRGLVMPAYNEAKKIAQVGTPEFVKSFVAQVAKIPAFMEMAKAQAESYSGILSTIKGHIGLIFLHLSGAAMGSKAETFWTKLREGAKEFSDNLGKFVSDAAPYLREIGNFLSDTFGTVWATIKATYVAFKPLLLLIGSSLGLIMKVLSPVLKAATWLLNIMAKHTNQLWQAMDAFYGISDGLKQSLDYVDNIFIKLQMMGVFLKRTWDAMGQSLKDFVDIAPKTMKEAADTVMNAGPIVMEALSGNLKPAKEAIAGGYGDIVGGAIGAVNRPAGMLFEAIRNSITNNTDNSNTTNIYTPKEEKSSWLMKNQFDTSGRP